MSHKRRKNRRSKNKAPATTKKRLNNNQKTDGLDTRKLLPLWRIEGKVTLVTPLSIGSGLTVPLTDDVAEDKDSFVIEITKDHKGLPYIPASSFKGALRALAKNSKPKNSKSIEDDEAYNEHINLIFGTEDKNETTPALVEFCNIYQKQAPNYPVKLPKYEPTTNTANITHVSINRDIEAAEDQHLFKEQVVPAGTVFTFECTARNIDESAIKTLLCLLRLAGDTESNVFSLGSNQNKNNGIISWELSGVKKINSYRSVFDDIRNNKKFKNDIWSPDTVLRIDNFKPIELSIKSQPLLLKDIELDFSSPFLSSDVYVAKKDEVIKKTSDYTNSNVVNSVVVKKTTQSQNKTVTTDSANPPDAIPRANSIGKYVLPASSIIGVLRSRAEKILRTLDIPTQNGYEAQSIILKDNKDEAENQRVDLASVLFGAGDWKGIIKMSDFIETGAIIGKDADGTKTDQLKMFNHDMIAVDRVMGGTKNGAKFQIQTLVNPKLKGSISIDLDRLNKLANRLNRNNLPLIAIDLLSKVLTDLDEGEITFGYGASKGYGKCVAKTMDIFTQQIKAHLVVEDTLEHGLKKALSEFATFAKSENSNLKALELPAQKLTDKTLDPVLPPTSSNQKDGATTNSFYNPYVFIPFANSKSENSVGISNLPWLPYEDVLSAHSHAKFDGNKLHGTIYCQLETRTPIFIGSGDKQTNESVPHIANFKLDGKICIPATSLRGVISNLHESITASAMRVIDNNSYSVRAGFKNCLKGGKGSLFKKNDKWYVACDDGKEHLILEDAWTNFYLLADERTLADKTLPEVKGNIKRNDDCAKFGDKVRPVEGHVVYFNLNTKDEVNEIAYSQIWRKLIKSDDNEVMRTKDFLPDNQSAPLNPDRQLISPTEYMFGFVEEDVNDKAKSRNFKSKVVFSFANSTDDVQLLDQVILKILASPKPPAPSMYFDKDEGQSQFISKTALAKAPKDFKLKGKKYYLHAKRCDNKVVSFNSHGYHNNGEALPPWQSHLTGKEVSKTQQVSIKPIDINQTFDFKVDFENLTQAELASLCASINPDDNYEHKIGMGKPIGLGSVKMSITKIELINKQQKYCYAGDSAQTPFKTTVEEKDVKKLIDQHMHALKSEEPAVYNAIKIVGNPNKVKHLVHYPQLKDRHLEKELFKYFGKNEKSKQEKRKSFFIRSFNQHSSILEFWDRDLNKKQNK